MQWLGCTSMHIEHTRNRCEVNSTGEHLLPLHFFLNAKLPYGYFKMRIWNRAKGQTKA